MSPKQPLPKMFHMEQSKRCPALNGLCGLRLWRLLPNRKMPGLATPLPGWLGRWAEASSKSGIALLSERIVDAMPGKPPGMPGFRILVQVKSHKFPCKIKYER